MFLDFHLLGFGDPTHNSQHCTWEAQQSERLSPCLTVKTFTKTCLARTAAAEGGWLFHTALLSVLKILAANSSTAQRWWTSPRTASVALLGMVSLGILNSASCKARCSQAEHL